MSLSLETLVSVASLAGFIWGLRFLLPRARREHDRLALACAVLTCVVALLAWLLIGVGIE